ncbi:MAG: serine/threonine protein kinase [Candidatus Obscuribacterales bacterium]|nr:serine/threonine protein kinase [Candidatus Obscuribacterales bacterium]
MPFSSGTIIDNRFKILSLIGEGGMASVYEAEQFGTQRVVALKLMHPSLQTSEEQRSRFLREAKILSRLNHLSIAKFYAFGITEDLEPYLAMELCSGITLAELKRQGKEANWKRACAIIAECARAIAYAHSEKVIHRDLSTQNIVLQELNGKDSIKIIDFGLASLQENGEATLTNPGSLLGSALYMSPEQSRGEQAVAKSDVYALACILFELLSGKAPFEADTAIGVIYKHSKVAAPSLSAKDISGDLEVLLRALLDCCLSKDAEKRPAADRLAEILDQICAGKLKEAGILLEDSLKTPYSRQNQKKIKSMVLPFILIFSLLLVSVCFQKTAFHFADKFSSSPASKNELRMRRMSFEQVLEMSMQKKDIEGSQILNRWQRFQKSNKTKNTEWQEIACRYAGNLLSCKKYHLAAAVGLIGLTECKRITPADPETVLSLLNAVIAARNKINESSKNKAVLDEWNSIHPYKHDPVKQKILSDGLFLLRITEISFADGHEAAVLLKSFFDHNNGEANLATTSQFILSQCPDLFAYSKETGLEISALDWLLSEKSKSLASCFHDKLLLCAFEWLCKSNAGPAKEYWSKIPDELKKQMLENPFAVPSLDNLYASQKNYRNAALFCERRARYLVSCGKNSEALETFRKSLQWQSACKQEILTRADYKLFSTLFSNENTCSEEEWYQKFYTSYMQSYYDLNKELCQCLLSEVENEKFNKMHSKKLQAKLRKLRDLFQESPERWANERKHH